MIGRRTHCLPTLAATRLLIGSLILAMMQATALAYQDPPNAPHQQPTNRSSVDGPKQPISNSLTLELDKPIQREIALNETHSYRVVLVAGQYLNVIVDQREADVEIRCIGPDGKRIGFLQRRIKTPVPTPVSYRCGEVSAGVNLITGPRFSCKVTGNNRFTYRHGVKDKNS